jgi:hypothetical protein
MRRILPARRQGSDSQKRAEIIAFIFLLQNLADGLEEPPEPNEQHAVPPKGTVIFSEKPKPHAYEPEAPHQA